MLRASRRVLRPGGRTAFFTIHHAPGLSAAGRRRASRDGPSAGATTRPYRELLEAAGFTGVTQADCTAEFVAVTQAWIGQWDANRDGMVALLGAPAFRQRQARRRRQLRAASDGILCRSLFTATWPGE